MRQLSIEERLARLEEHVVAIRQMMEKILNQKKAIKPPNGEAKEIMSVKQVAQFLGLDANLIYIRCMKGDIPHFRIGKQYRFKKEEILKWVKTQKGHPDISVDDYVNRYMQNNILNL